MQGLITLLIKSRTTSHLVQLFLVPRAELRRPVKVFLFEIDPPDVPLLALDAELVDGVVGVGKVRARDGVAGQTPYLALSRVQIALEHRLLVEDADAADAVFVGQEDVELGQQERARDLRVFF